MPKVTVEFDKENNINEEDLVVYDYHDEELPSNDVIWILNIKDTSLFTGFTLTNNNKLAGNISDFFINQIARKFRGKIIIEQE